MILNFEQNCVDLEGIKSGFDNITTVGTVEVSLGTGRCKFVYWEDESDFVFFVQ